jgi:DNA-binding NarL/FixJ family response regulator
MITVLLADDQALGRAGFRLILDETENITVVGEAADGLTAVTLVEQLEPIHMLVDIRMPGIDGIEGTRRIRSRRSTQDDGPRVIILTTFDLDEYVFSALPAGASGFVFKDALAADLVAAIRVVAAGQSVAAPTVTRRLIEHFVRSAPHCRRGDGRHPHIARTRRAAPGRARTIQPRDRPTAVRDRRNRQNPREPPSAQARPTRPHPGRHLRPPTRPRLKLPS